MTQQPIIAFVDGSSYSSVICEYAAFFAKRAGLPVKLYHVVRVHPNEPARDLSGAINLGARSKLLDELTTADELQAKELHSKGWHILAQAKSELENLGIASVELRLRAGDIAQSLSTKEKAGELVIIGKRGEVNAQSKTRLGQNFERLVRASTKPVFVSNAEYREPSNILVAFDGSAPSQKALMSVLQNPLFAARQVTALTVNGSQNADISLFKDKLQNEANLTWKDAFGAAKQVILDEIKSESYDMLAMGAYGHSKLRNFFIGSTTTALINSARVPILLSK